MLIGWLPHHWLALKVHTQKNAYMTWQKNMALLTIIWNNLKTYTTHLTFVEAVLQSARQKFYLIKLRVLPFLTDTLFQLITTWQLLNVCVRYTHTLIYYIIYTHTQLFLFLRTIRCLIFLFQFAFLLYTHRGARRLLYKDFINTVFIFITGLCVCTHIFFLNGLNILWYV